MGATMFCEIVFRCRPEVAATNELYHMKDFENNGFFKIQSCVTAHHSFGVKELQLCVSLTGGRRP